MYGSATAQNQCTGLPRRWTYMDGDWFRHEEFYDFARFELDVLSWLVKSGRFKHLKHKWNTGKVININGKYPDGYDPETRTAVFCDGCRWHGHLCELTDGLRERWDDVEAFQASSRKDKAIRSFLRARGYKIHVVRECEWKHMKRTIPEIKVILFYF